MKLQNFDFRIYDDEAKKFITSLDELSSLSKDKELEFFTGESDKLGKKIYVGDLIKDVVDETIYNINKTFEVCFNTIDGVYLQDIDSPAMLTREINFQDYVVIANIHEKQELIKLPSAKDDDKLSDMQKDFRKAAQLSKPLLEAIKPIDHKPLMAKVDFDELRKNK